MLDLNILQILGVNSICVEDKPTTKWFCMTWVTEMYFTTSHTFLEIHSVNLHNYFLTRSWSKIRDTF